MFNNLLYKLFPPLLFVGLLIPIFVVFAQSDGSVPPSETPQEKISETVATSTVATTYSSRATESGTLPPTGTARPTTSAPTVPTPVLINETATITPVLAEDTASTEDMPGNFILWIALAILAILPFGYLAAQSLKKKKAQGEEKEKDDSRCFNIKKLLDEKLKELTDLKGRLESEAKNKAKETMREAVQGTSAGEMLAMVEKAEKEYERLKKLYEECILEFGVNKKRVYIIHGWGGSPNKNWIPWLKSELEKRGYKVFAPEMPDTDAPQIGAWVAHLSKIVGTPDKDTYFVGHSIGCQTVLRYLETVEQSVGGAIFVAGWFNLENLEDEESENIAEPWIKTPIHIAKIREALPKSVLLISDDDPFGAVEENKRKFSEITPHKVVLPHAGHIDKSEEPAILSEFLSLFGSGK